VLRPLFATRPRMRLLSHRSFCMGRGAVMNKALAETKSSQQPKGVAIITMSNLLLRRASLSRKGGSWSDDDYDVIEDARIIGFTYSNG